MPWELRAIAVEVDSALHTLGYAVTDPEVDIFDREAVFIDRILLKTLANFPELKVVLEHITPRQSADLVLSAGNVFGFVVFKGGNPDAIGVMLVVEGMGGHVSKGYIYSAMAFSPL